MYSSPVRHSPPTPCGAVLPFDLHVLGMPPAFSLSQDQTLQLKLQVLKGPILPKADPNQKHQNYCFNWSALYCLD